jgi:branched-chain amino acid aminotransferase
VRAGVLLTPPVDAGLLVGVTRAYVLALAAVLQRPAVEQVLVEADLESVEEAFLTSTTREIVPVVRIGERPIGDGRPGAVTRQLMDAFTAGVAQRLS